ncbi:MAG TPA: amidohydrolase family protein [Actinocatenispora sp.]
MALHVRGVLLPDDEVRDLWLVGDRVTFEPVPAAETVATGGYVLPGLVDAHCHLGIARGASPVTELDTARALARTDRDTGVLALRDAGSPLYYPELEDEVDLPRLVRAGRHLAPPKRYLRGVAKEVTAQELPAAAAEQARLGGGWIKLVGDWIDRGEGDLGPTYDEATMTAAIGVAHAAGARVAVHTFSEEAVSFLVRAGVDSVEHGTGLSLELVDEMARRGTALVPTMINIETFDGIAAQADAKFPAYADHMRRLKQTFPRLVGAAVDAGVPVYVGTDAGGGIDHGLAAEEMLLLRDKAGLAAADVLAAASWRAREWLGLPGLVEGGLADLVVYDRDPRADLTVVREPSRIVLRGRVIR